MLSSPMPREIFHKPKTDFNFKQEPLAEKLINYEIARSPDTLGRAMTTDLTPYFFQNLFHKVNQKPPENINLEIKGQTRSGKSTDGLTIYVWECKAYGYEPTVENILPNQAELLYKLKDARFGESYLIDEQTPETYTEGISAEAEQLGKNLNICAKMCNNLTFIFPPKFTIKSSPYGLETIGKDTTNFWNKCLLYDLSDRRLLGFSAMPMGYVLIPKFLDKKYYQKPREKWSEKKLQTYINRGYEYLSQLEEDYETKKDIWIEEVRSLSGNSRNKIKEEYAQTLADDLLFSSLSNKERSAYVQIKINAGEFMEMAKTEIETIVSMATIKMRQ